MMLEHKKVLRSDGYGRPVSAPKVLDVKMRNEGSQDRSLQRQKGVENALHAAEHKLGKRAEES